MIRKINLLRLRNAEFLTFFKTLLGFIGGNETVAAAVAAPKAALDALVQRIEELFKNDPSSPLTNTLQDLDAERDRYISGLSKICDGYRNSPDAGERTAAGTLFHSIGLYGDAGSINDQGINAETATIGSLLSDWNNKPELASAIITLNLAGWVKALQTANVAFSDTYAARTANSAATSTPDTLKAKRAETINAWYELRKKIDANRDLAPDATQWDAVVAQINTLTDQYGSTLAARAGRAGAGANKPPVNG